MAVDVRRVFDSLNLRDDRLALSVNRLKFQVRQDVLYPLFQHRRHFHHRFETVTNRPRVPVSRYGRIIIMKLTGNRHYFIGSPFVIVVTLLFHACGGGGGGTGTPQGSELAPKTLNWNMDNRYINNDSYNPVTELKNYEIYIQQDNINFIPSVNYVTINAINNGQLVLSYDLRQAFIKLSLLKNVTYYISMRVLTNDNVYSDFSIPGPVGGFKYE